MANDLQKYYEILGIEVPEALKLPAASEFSGIPMPKLKKSPGLLMSLLDILDRPGNATRALLVGKLGGLKGLVPFAQTIEDLTGFDIALNDEDKVTGEEVLEKWTGIKDKKGKFDLADVLGFTIEVIADPLWLVGGGVTKVGKAGATVRGLVKESKAIGTAAQYMTKMAASGLSDDVLRASLKGRMTKDTLAQIFRHYRKGTPLPAGVSNKVKKSFETLYKAGGGTIPPGTFKAKSWAEQAVAGERALLSIGLPGMRKPVIKGVGVLDKIDTIATKVRTGVIGKKFLHPVKRVKTKHADFTDMATKLSRDDVAFGTRQHYDKIDDIFKSLDNDLADKLPDYMEFTGGAKLAQDRMNVLSAVDDVFNGKAAGNTQEMLQNIGIKIDDIYDVPDVVKKYRKVYGKNLKEMNAHKVDLLKDLDSVQVQRLTNADSRVGELFGESLAKEQARHLPIEGLKGPFGYMPRMTTQKFRKWIQRNKGKVINHKGHTFSVKHGFMKGRDEYLRNLTRDEIQDLFSQYGFKGKVFDSPAATIAERMAKSEKVSGTADTVYEAIKQFSNSNGEGRAVTDLFKDLGWKVPDSKAADLGLKSFNNTFLDEDIYRALTNQYKIANESALDDIFKKINATYKTALTVGFPAYHARNALSNVALNFMAGVQNPNSYVKAMRLQNAARKTNRIMKKKGVDFLTAAKEISWPKIKTASGVMDGQHFYRAMDESNLLGQVSGHFAKEEMKPFVNIAGSKFSKKAGRKTRPYDFLYSVGQTVENNARLAHVVEKAQGLGLDDAVRSSKKALFDYGDLSEFEKNVLRDRVYLFYTFSRKNIAAQSRYLLSEPAKMAIFAKATGGTPGADKRADTPKYMRERMDMPTPFEDEEGRTINVRGLGLPMEEAFGPISAPGSGLFDRASRFVSRQMSRTVPYLKTPIELATKKNLFFDEDIRNTGEFVAQSLPTSRITNTVSRLGSDRQGKITDVLTGVKAGPAFDDYYKYASDKEAIQSQFQRDPNIKRFTRYYPVDKEKVTPGTQALLDRISKR